MKDTLPVLDAITDKILSYRKKQNTKPSKRASAPDVKRKPGGKSKVAPK